MDKLPSWRIALIPLAVLVAILFFVVRYFGTDSLTGASQTALLLATGVTIFLSVFVCKGSWRKLETAIADNIRGVSTPLVILLFIGALGGTWMVSGVVPTFMYYGLKLISPSIFLFAVCVICALVALLTGSSWTTIATIGVALIGIGEAMGYSSAWTAGAIISGAYFGDKVSPLSDTTVLASSSAGVPLFEHIRYMRHTTIPSMGIALAIFLLVSIFHPKAPEAHLGEVSAALSGTFNISLWLMIVPVLTGMLIVRKVPAIVTLMAASGLASIAALIFQPEIIASFAGESSLADFKTVFVGSFLPWFGATNIDTGIEAYNDLVATRGMNGMMPTIFLIICAATFGGVFTGSGMLQSLTDLMLRHVHTRIGVVVSTVITGIFSNCATGDQYLSIILTASLYKRLYDDKGYDPRLLSRTTEDSATVTSVLIPWNSCGMTQSTVLHVATMSYLPFCFFNLLSPLMTILVSALSDRKSDKAAK